MHVEQKTLKMILKKKIFQVNKECSFWEGHLKCDKGQRIKCVKTEAKRSYLVSEPNYHTANIFSENILAIEMKKYHKFYKYINQSIQNCKNEIVQTKFDTNHELEKSLLRFMKGDLVGKIMT